jgi:hypothetical protein
MRKRHPDYLSYMLRLWRVDNGDQETVWRASLQDSLTGQQVGFASLEELFAFLRRIIPLAPDMDEDASGSGT